MRSVRITVLGLAVLATSLVGLAVPAHAETILVGPGQSIQAAVNSAEPGDEIVVAPGTYAENVEVREDDITIRGAGSGDDGTILVPPATEADTACTRNDVHGIGFCVLGPLGNEPEEPFEPGGPVVLNFHLSNFQIRGFEDSGVFLFKARHARLNALSLVDNGEYGMFSTNSQGTRIANSSATGNGEAGYYIGDTRNSANGVLNSAASGNGIGIFVRDATQGVIAGNTSTDNCLGIFLLNTGAPIGVSRWTVRDNVASNNNAACPAGEGPPQSGAGIALLGTRDVWVHNNTADGNQASGPSTVTGGIVLKSAVPAGGPTPHHNLIEENSAHGNTPADLVYDGTGTNNRFEDNDCGTSQPPGRCG